MALILAMLAGAEAGPALAQAASGAADSPQVAQPTMAERELTEATITKTKAEAKKLQRDNSVGWRLLSSLAPLLTALIAAGGLFVSVKKAGDDRRDALEREAKERSLEAEKRADAQQAAETTRFDERFEKAVAGLSSSSPGEQSGAAVLVASIVREKQAALSDQGLQLLLVSLQTPHDEACERLLRIALEQFAKAAPERLVDGLAHVQTSYLNFANLEIPRLDIAFSVLRKADFHNAKLVGCRAYKARLEQANFERADLTGAEWVKAEAPASRFKQATLAGAGLRLAKLSGADFYKANLRGANLRAAELVGTKFHRASLAQAVFHDAVLDDKALQSILKTEDWEAAGFDQPVRERLEELANE